MGRIEIDTDSWLALVGLSEGTRLSRQIVMEDYQILATLVARGELDAMPSVRALGRRWGWGKTTVSELIAGDRDAGRRDRDGWVYAITAAGAIKIGWSTEPADRIRQLQTGSAQPLSLVAKVPGTITLERQIHSALGPWRMEGEWFEDCDGVRQLLAAYGLGF